MADLNHTLRRLDPEDEREWFDCGDTDLNEFFTKDSIHGGLQLISVSYATETAGRVSAFFSVSNDSIRAKDYPPLTWRKIIAPIPRKKRYRSLPAVKIGRLAVCLDFQRSGLGTQILDFIKAWFTFGNKTGCRFIVVDAYNKSEIVEFYRQNGFDFLDNDERESTRLMYFDLATFKPE